MTDDEVWAEVVRWTNKITGSAVIRGWQGGSRPTTPYLMVNLTGIAEVRQHVLDIEYVTLESEEIEARPVIETEWRFSLHSYGETPTPPLRKIRTAEKLNQIVEPLMPGLHIFDLSQIRNIPEWQNEDWKPRAQMDLNVRGLVRDGMIIDTIEQFSFNWTRS